MKKPLLGSMRSLLTLVAASVFALGVSAEVLVSDNFDGYTAGNLAGQGSWVVSSGSTDNVQLVEGSLSYAGYSSSTDGKSVKLFSEQTSGEDVKLPFAEPLIVNSGDVVYYSALVKVNSLAAQFNNGTEKTTMSSFITLGRAGVNVIEYMHIHAVPSSEGKFKFAVGRNQMTSSGTNVAKTTAEYNIGETYLVVVKYTGVDGSTNDKVELYVNPVLDAEPAVADAVYDGSTGSDISASGAQFLQLKQGASGTASCPDVTVDAVKVFTAWSDMKEVVEVPEGSYKNMAEFVAAGEASEEGIEGKVISKMVVTQVYGDYFYMQDESMAALFEKSVFFMMNEDETVAIGDCFTDANMLYANYDGDIFWYISGTYTKTHGTAEPELVPVADFMADKAKYANRLIKIENLKFDQTGKFEAGKVYTAASGEQKVNVNFFPGNDIYATDVPAGNVSLTGICRAASNAISPRSLADIEAFVPDPVVTLNTNAITIENVLYDGDEPALVSFIVKATDLKGDITLSVNSEVVTLPVTTIAADNELLAGEGVTVEVEITPEYIGAMSVAEVTVVTEGVEPQKVTISWLVYDAVDNLAAMFTKAADGMYFYGAVKGEVAVTAVNGAYIFLQDETKAITLKGVADSDYKVGNYYKYMEFEVAMLNATTVDVINLSSNGELVRNEVVEAETVTFEELVAENAKYLNRLVKVEKIDFASTGTFPSGDGVTAKRVDIKQGDAEGKLSLFLDSDIMGSDIPDYKADITGIFRYVNNSVPGGKDILISPRSLEDIVRSSVDTDVDVVTTGLTAWSNNGNLCIESDGVMVADVYSVIGQRVMTIELHSGLNTIAIRQGAYIVRAGDKAVKVYVK